MSIITRLLSPVRSTPEQRFWDWFAANSHRFVNVERDQKVLFGELGRQLSRIHPSLTFEFGPQRDQRRELVISADGIKDAFPAVQRLVAAAPDLPDWWFIPFRPRGEIGPVVQFNGYSLDPEDVWFKLEADGSKVGLYLFLPQPDGVAEDTMALASFILLDHALGEFDVEMKLGFIERLPLPPKPEDHGLRPFKEIPAAVDRLFGELHPS